MNRRMEGLAEMVARGVVLADIGTDSAQLPILLVEKRRIEKAYACDIAHGPLLAAERNIAAHHLEAQILPVLSDGLDHVPMDADAIVIAGMGVRTAVGILERGGKRLPFFQQILVQVNDDPIALRIYIAEKGWQIQDEIFLVDRGQEYEAVSFLARPGKRYSELEIQIGPVLLKRKEEAYVVRCRKRLALLEKIVPLKKEGDPEKKRLQKEAQALRIFLDMKKA
jgi:tRNA (adenine22-N1)-methyltransferase